jgi:XTP/dITP diphosphohydrolase
MEPRLVAIERLLKIMDELREKCPWDRKQTIESLRHLSIEEVYELSDAILEGDPQKIKKELGDVLLHIVFYARIGSEKRDFDLADIANSLCEKLISRHPHIYGTVDGELKEVVTEEDVKQNWEKLKLREGEKSVLSGVPVSLPAMIKAQRIQEKAAGVGFDWERPEQVYEKVEEELRELNVEVEAKHQLKMEQEFGDVLFALINYARFIGVNPEDALEKTNRKFIKRFQYMEERVKEDGKKISDYDLKQLDVFWEQAKLKGE